ncbi:hypothetical protein [Micromonospora globbae]|uniref:hypothetical protein n=1 Tax=Micromonospora globbae TaxID=1894969 RepID=UPI0037A93B7C|nr:hypothetical protein OH732_05315 [Micromonospora globbae]
MPLAAGALAEEPFDEDVPFDADELDVPDVLDDESDFAGLPLLPFDDVSEPEERESVR